VQVGNSTIVQAISVIATLCATCFPAYGAYSGGSGTAEDPYQIATAADLIALGESARLYDRHFILTADIDLDPKLPGRKVFDKAVIAPASHMDTYPYVQGTHFRGVFDGNGHTISRLTVTGRWYLGLFGWLGSGGEIRHLGVLDVNVVGSDGYIGGLVGRSAGAIVKCYSTGLVGGGWDTGGLVGENYRDDRGRGELTACYSTAAVGGGSYTGGLVGHNDDASLTQCYSTGAVAGHWFVGGLVGYNEGDVTQCYSVTGTSGKSYVGGLVGENYGAVTQCYSAGPVSGTMNYVGGLMGYSGGSETCCFWDMEASGRTESYGGTGKTTAEMRKASTFPDAGWDFVGETANGTEDIWWILEGQDYPHLWWEANNW
jgi:hypothetical protein